MAESAFKDVPTEELLKKRKTSYMVTSLLFGMIIVIVILNIFLYFVKGVMPSGMLTGIALLPIVIINYSQVKKIDEEIKSRGV